jgi:hypothetical protein
VPPAPEPAEGGPGFQRATLRRACSFPGLLRVLIPEESFQPQVLAVRVVDVSPGGARLETRQLTPRLAGMLGTEKRFMRLEVMLPTSHRANVAGRVAWVEREETMSFLGVRFEQETRAFDECFVENLGEGDEPELVCLPSPQLDPFPSTTSSTEIDLRGSAPGAKGVLCRVGKRDFRAEVANGRFQLRITLRPGTTNFASVTALRDTVSSIPTPICVVHALDARDTVSFHGESLVESIERSPAGDRLTARFQGDARRFFPILRKLSEVLVNAEEVHLEISLTGDLDKAEGIIRSLEDPH